MKLIKHRTKANHGQTHLRKIKEVFRIFSLESWKLPLKSRLNSQKFYGSSNDCHIIVIYYTGWSRVIAFAFTICSTYFLYHQSISCAKLSFAQIPSIISLCKSKLLWTAWCSQLLMESTSWGKLVFLISK